MINLYHFLHLLWRLDISVWQVNQANNFHITNQKIHLDG